MKTYRVTAYNTQYNAYRCTEVGTYPTREVFIDFTLYNPDLRSIKLIGRTINVQEEIPFCVIACGAQIAAQEPEPTTNNEQQQVPPP